MILSIGVGILALLATGCVTDEKIELTNGCQETVVFIHFEEHQFAPEYRDEMYSQAEWVTLESGESSDVHISGMSDATVTLTVVADGAEQVWDPVVLDITYQDPELRKNGSVELAGDNCG